MINSIATSCSIQDAPKIISEHCHATLHHRLNRSTRNCCNGRDSTGSCFVQAKFLQDVSCPTSFRAFDVALDAESYVVLDAHVCVCTHTCIDVYIVLYCIELYYCILYSIVYYYCKNVMICFDIAWHDVIWNDMKWHDTIWYKIWCDMSYVVIIHCLLDTMQAPAILEYIRPVG